MTHKELNFIRKVTVTTTLLLLIHFKLTLCSDRVCKVLVGIDEPLYKHYGKDLSLLTDLIENHFDKVNEIFHHQNNSQSKREASQDTSSETTTEIITDNPINSTETIQDDSSNTTESIQNNSTEPIKGDISNTIDTETSLNDSTESILDEPQISSDPVVGPFTGAYSDIRFKVSRIQVIFGSCDSFKYENCTQNRDKYLEIFDQYDFSDFCLAFMFTYLDFDNGTAGLASVGTLCKKTKNTGFITLLNHGQEVSLDEATLTLAHELGHNFGAGHDDEEKLKDQNCGEGYIMGSTTNTTSETKKRFSNCSVNAIRSKVESVLSEDSLNCLLEDDETPLEVSLCGNGLVEPGEECDCGQDEVACDDPCCYPAHISASERSANDSALPCSRAARTRCLTPPELFYGIYLPLIFIFTITILVAVFLRHDWTRDKSLFKHVTEGNIRIVTAASVRARNTRNLESGSSLEQSNFK